MLVVNEEAAQAQALLMKDLLALVQEHKRVPAEGQACTTLSLAARLVATSSSSLQLRRQAAQLLTAVAAATCCGGLELIPAEAAKAAVTTIAEAESLPLVRDCLLLLAAALSSAAAATAGNSRPPVVQPAVIKRLLLVDEASSTEAPLIMRAVRAAHATARAAPVFGVAFCSSSGSSSSSAAPAAAAAALVLTWYQAAIDALLLQASFLWRAPQLTPAEAEGEGGEEEKEEATRQLMAHCHSVACSLPGQPPRGPPALQAGGLRPLSLLAGVTHSSKAVRLMAWELLGQGLQGASMRAQLAGLQVWLGLLDMPQLCAHLVDDLKNAEEWKLGVNLVSACACAFQKVARSMRGPQRLHNRVLLGATRLCLHVEIVPPEHGLGPGPGVMHSCTMHHDDVLCMYSIHASLFAPWLLMYTGVACAHFMAPACVHMHAAGLQS